MPHILRGLTIQASLLLGFILIFGLLLISGYSLLRRMSEVETRAARINMQFTHNEELLFTLRTQILLSAIYRRDALMDTDPGDFQYYVVQLRETRQAVERALAEYEPVVSSPAERENRDPCGSCADSAARLSQPPGGRSSTKVTGPSLISSTAMWAPKRPRSTR